MKPSLIKKHYYEHLRRDWNNYKTRKTISCLQSYRMFKTNYARLKKFYRWLGPEQAFVRGTNWRTIFLARGRGLPDGVDVLDAEVNERSTFTTRRHQPHVNFSNISLGSPFVQSRKNANGSSIEKNPASCTKKKREKKPYAILSWYSYVKKKIHDKLITIHRVKLISYNFMHIKQRQIVSVGLKK